MASDARVKSEYLSTTEQRTIYQPDVQCRVIKLKMQTQFMYEVSDHTILPIRKCIQVHNLNTHIKVLEAYLFDRSKILLSSNTAVKSLIKLSTSKHCTNG